MYSAPSLLHHDIVPHCLALNHVDSAMQAQTDWVATRSSSAPIGGVVILICSEGIEYAVMLRPSESPPRLAVQP